MTNNKSLIAGDITMSIKKAAKRLSTFRPGQVKRFFAGLGPGLVTGAADDDPSGISTYSVTGASFGYGTLWTALFSFPLMVGVQMMCARLGMVTGRGLAGVIRARYPHWILWGACLLLIIANVFNIGADLGGMAESTEMVTGIPSYYLTPIYALVIILFLFFSSYKRIASIFKWLTVVLFAYVFAAFLASPDWLEVLKATFIPRIEWSSRFLATFVGILGTTISPYLFFWQSSHMVEEDIALGRTTIEEREGATDREIVLMRRDVATGMFLSNLAMYFIILTTAATLHANGQTEITTAQQAAEALRPLAGNAAYLLFTLGIVGTGMLAVPVLAGSAAYAVAEAQTWHHASLEHPIRVAYRFYAVVALAMIIGLALVFTGFDAVKMLFYAAILNGILAPPLIVLVTLLTSDPTVMGNRTSSAALKTMGWLTAVVMTLATIAMFATI